MSIQDWQRHFEEMQQTLKAFLADPSHLNKCETLSQKIVQTIRAGGTLFSCGNGGSHCEALHFAEEWTGRFEKNRAPIAALALGESTHTTCVGNDFGFDHIFSRQLEALSRKGDFVLFLSTSGKSPNLLAAAEVAQRKGLYSAALLGRDGGPLAKMVDLPIIVPAQPSARIQEVHLQLIHTAIALAEAEILS